MKLRLTWLRAMPMLMSALVALCLIGCPPLMAQRGQRGPAGPPPTAQQAAPIDPTGYWESYVNEDWLLRMVTPKKGDFQTLPINAEGRRVGNMWDPDKDSAANLQCKAYGAAAVMRIPGRLHITWNDPNTLNVDLEAGMQNRVLHFAASSPTAGEPAWQGYSAAQWIIPGTGRGRQKGTTLKVVTTHLREGYLRKNGVPYSSDAVVTEYFNVLDDAAGGPWLVVTTIVDDPKYLTMPFVTSTHFRKLADGSAWKPEPCVAK